MMDGNGPLEHSLLNALGAFYRTELNTLRLGLNRYLRRLAEFCDTNAHTKARYLDSWGR